MINIDKIRSKLIEAIKQSGMTQTELAKQIGVVPQSVAQYFSGRAMPALDTFAKICAVLDVDPADILCIDDYKKIKFFLTSVVSYFEMLRQGSA